jgi:hypothetical protein
VKYNYPNHACFYGDVLNKAKHLKYETLNNLICKWYSLATIVDSFTQGFVAMIHRNHPIKYIIIYTMYICQTQAKLYVVNYYF